MLRPVLALFITVPAIAGLALCLCRSWRMWRALALGVPIAYGLVTSIILRAAQDPDSCRDASDCSEGLAFLLIVFGPIVVWAPAAAISGLVLSLRRRKRAADPGL